MPTFLLSFALVTLLIVDVVQSHKMSRHLITEDLSMVILIADPAARTTEGPFDGVESDYITSSDMLGAARAGSPGVGVDRSGVLNGVPITLNFKVYAIAEDSMDVGYEYEGVEVILWQTDALGVYSAVSSLQTTGQKWLRGRQVTDSNGAVTFNTILPGPYVGRALHYHIRFRLPGESGYVATSQIVIKDSDWEQYRSMGPYASSSSAFRSLATDRIFNSLGPVFQDLLTLNLDGSFTTGVTAGLQFGLLTTDDSLLRSPTGSLPSTTSRPATAPTPTLVLPTNPSPATPRPATPTWPTWVFVPFTSPTVPSPPLSSIASPQPTAPPPPVVAPTSWNMETTWITATNPTWASFQTPSSPSPISSVGEPEPTSFWTSALSPSWANAVRRDSLPGEPSQSPIQSLVFVATMTVLFLCIDMM